MVKQNFPKKYKINKNIVCMCSGKDKLISSICGCINPKCNYDRWECTKCDTKKRYKSWIVLHYDNKH